MIDLDNWKRVWALLDEGERRKAWITLGVMLVGALSSAVMVGSVMPFLSVLSDPRGSSGSRPCRGSTRRSASLPSMPS